MAKKTTNGKEHEKVNPVGTEPEDDTPEESTSSQDEPTPAEDVVWLPIDQIKVDRRIRKDLGDLTTLKNSIKEHGQIAPLGVDKGDYSLIYGERRYNALKELGHTQALVRLQDYNELDRLLVEYDENAVRKSFTPSEAVEAKRRIEPKLKMQAKERQKEGARRGGKKAGAKGKGKKTRSVIAEMLGMSHDTLRKAEEVVSAIEKYPDNNDLLKIYQDMDKTGNVNRAHGKLRRLLEDESSSQAPDRFGETDPRKEWYRWTWEPITDGAVNEDALRAPYDTEIPAKKEDVEGWSHVIVQDIFDGNPSREDVRRVLEVCSKVTSWIYVFMTSSPEELTNHSFPENCWIGVYVNSQEELVEAVKCLAEVKAPAKFLEIQSYADTYEFASLEGVDWVVVGSQSKETYPTWEDVLSIEAGVFDHDKPVYYKPELDWKMIAPQGRPDLG